MKKIFIPIGSDCFTTFGLKDNDLRFQSLPFYWIVTFDGIYDIIKNDFLDFIPKNDDNNITVNNSNDDNLEVDTHNNAIYNDKYKILFLHNKFPEDNEKIKKRINRFKQILETTTQEIIFIRKTHMMHHHEEMIKNFNCNNVKDEILESEKLSKLLTTSYPKLNFKIYLILSCNICYEPINYYTDCSNIVIINISDKSSNENFYETYYNIIKNIKNN